MFIIPSWIVEQVHTINWLKKSSLNKFGCWNMSVLTIFVTCAKANTCLLISCLHNFSRTSATVLSYVIIDFTTHVRRHIWEMWVSCRERETCSLNKNSCSSVIKSWFILNFHIFHHMFTNFAKTTLWNIWIVCFLQIFLYSEKLKSC